MKQNRAFGMWNLHTTLFVTFFSSWVAQAQEPPPSIVDGTVERDAEKTAAASAGEAEEAAQKALKAADEVKSILARLKSHSAIRFGFSLGLRWTPGETGDDALQSVAIVPSTGRLDLATAEPFDVVASAVVAAYPWRDPDSCKDSSFACNFGFLLNINLAKLGVSESEVFNESIQGGFGVFYNIHDSIAVGLTIERRVVRLPREGVGGRSNVRGGDSHCG